MLPALGLWMCLVSTPPLPNPHISLSTSPSLSRRLRTRVSQGLWKENFDNLDSGLKSRDITLPTKVHIVRAVVFPVIMHGCEN